jgi:hypothetical protein
MGVGEGSLVGEFNLHEIYYSIFALQRVECMAEGRWVAKSMELGWRLSRDTGLKIYGVWSLSRETGDKSTELGGKVGIRVVKSTEWGG